MEKWTKYNGNWKYDTKVYKPYDLKSINIQIFISTEKYLKVYQNIMAIYDFITNTYANYCLLVYNQKQVEH